MFSLNQQGDNLVMSADNFCTDYWEGNLLTETVPADIYNQIQQWPQQINHPHHPRHPTAGNVPQAVVFQHYKQDLNANHYQYSNPGVSSSSKSSTSFINQIQQWPQQIIHPHHPRHPTAGNVPQAVVCQHYKQDLNANHYQYSNPDVSSSSKSSTSFINQMSHVPLPCVQHYRQCSLHTSTASASRPRLGIKTIDKRKRRRTMFTTDQIETLESVFRQSPYITREERQVLVNKLLVSDNTVKVWFQNRRLREKKELEEIKSSPLSPSIDSYNIARLAQLENELCNKTDQSGFVTLDEKSIGEIVSAVDIVLSHSINLNNIYSEVNNISNKVNNSSTDVYNASNGVHNVSNELNHISKQVANVEVAVDSEDSDYAGSIYEPISPASSEDTNEDALRWDGPYAPEKSLQKLFNLHFC